MKRIICLLMTVLMCFGLFSCAKALPDDVVLSFKSTQVDDGFFRSQVSAYKSSYVFNYMGLDKDSPAIWAADSGEEGVTIGEGIINLSLAECAAMAWIVEYAKSSGIVLDEEDRELINSDIEVLKEECGGEEEYQKFIKDLGFTNEDMIKNAEFSLLYEYGIEKLTGEGGVYEITDAEVDKYFEENYIAVKHVYVNNVAELDENGNYVAITDENKKKQDEKAAMLEEDLTSGVDFDLLYGLSEDQMAVSFPNGMIMGVGDVNSVIYEEAALKLEMGEWVRVDVDDFGVYFIKRVEMPEDKIASKKEDIRYILRSDIQNEIWETYQDKFVINEKYIEDFDINSIGIY